MESILVYGSDNRLFTHFECGKAIFKTRMSRPILFGSGFVHVANFLKVYVTNFILILIEIDLVFDGLIEIVRIRAV